MFLNIRLNDESSGVRHVRRMFHPGRGLGGPRARRSNMHFTSSTTGGLSTSQSSSQSSNYSREAMDPIAGQSHNTHQGGRCVKQSTFCFWLVKQKEQRGKTVRQNRIKFWPNSPCFSMCSNTWAVLLPWRFLVYPPLSQFAAWHRPCRLQLCRNEGLCLSGGTNRAAAPSNESPYLLSLRAERPPLRLSFLSFQL